MTRLLADRAQLVDIVRRHNPSADIKQCLSKAKYLEERFAKGTAADQSKISQSLLQSITLGPEAVVFAVKASVFGAMLQVGRSPIVDSEADDEENLDPLIIIRLPVILKRHGNEMRLVIPGDGQHRKSGPQLVNLLARAHLYLQHVTRAPDTSVSDVAKHFGVHRVDIGRILPLAFLVPKVADQILTGSQSDEMSIR